MKILNNFIGSLNEQRANKQQNVSKLCEINNISDAYYVDISATGMKALINEMQISKVVIYNEDALFYTQNLKIIKKI